MRSDDTDDHAESPTPRTEGQIIFTAPLRRLRCARGAVAFTADDPQADPPTDRLPSRAAQMLALAHELQRLIDEGEVADRAALAEQVGLTRARLTQLLDLLLLAPDIQEDVLFSTTSVDRRRITERRMRGVSRKPAWPAQRSAWNRLSPTIV